MTTVSGDWPRGASFALETARGTFNCRLDGPSHAPSIVFSNSHATDLSIWDEHANVLANQFNVVRYDQRGHGATPVGVEPVSFDTLADDVMSIMDALRIGKAMLVGVSMGAVTVLRCAARYPQRVTQVLASDGQWATPAGAAQTWQQRIDVASRGDLSALIEPTVERWFTPASRAARARCVDHARRVIGATSSQGYIACARAMQAYDFRADFPGLRMPVQYVVGALDARMPVVMREMHAATPRSALLELPGTAHLPCLESPAAFSAVLRRFATMKPTETGLVPANDAWRKE